MCILRSLWVIQLFSICCFSCVLSFSFYFFPYPRYFISLFTFSIFLYLNYLPTNSLYPLTYISVFSVYQSSPYFAFSLSSKSLPAESFFHSISHRSKGDSKTQNDNKRKKLLFVCPHRTIIWQIATPRKKNPAWPTMPGPPSGPLRPDGHNSFCHFWPFRRLKFAQ